MAKSEFMTPHQSLAANGKSFDWARRFLARMGGDAATLYRFCRVLDDMADGDIPDGPRRLLTIRDDLRLGAAPPTRFWLIFSLYSSEKFARTGYYRAY